jgi:hypothetical protein
MPQKIWSRPDNPTRAVARMLRITREQLGRAMHIIKRDAGLLPPDDVTIWDDGTVTVEQDVPICNIYDEI